MGWMLGVVLALGLTGCSLAGMTSRCAGEGRGGQQHPLGRKVTRVLAVPASLLMVAGESPPSGGQGEANLLPTWCSPKEGKLEIEGQEVTGS